MSSLSILLDDQVYNFADSHPVCFTVIAVAILLFMALAFLDIRIGHGRSDDDE